MKTNGAVESLSASLVVSWNAENITALKRFNMSAGYRIAEPQQDIGGIFLFVAFIIITVASYLSYRKKFMKPETKAEQKQHPRPRRKK
jgi:uncharacterized membrane protein